jgi:bifunctional non-homologous end joining protein LigD
VIQEHHPRGHNLDLGLERDGSLLSRALPKGVPVDPRKNWLAVRGEDNAISHLDRTENPPVGDGGVVRIRTFDRGDYTPHEFSEENVFLTFHGRLDVGKYAVLRRRDGNWFVHPVDPPAEDTLGEDEEP